MAHVKPHYQVVCRDCRCLNEATPSTQSWMARARPGIKRRPSVRATATARNRS